MNIATRDSRTDLSRCESIRNDFKVQLYRETRWLIGSWILDRHDPLHNRRIATWLGYLSNVTAGGGTAFLDLNIVAEPEMGSAIFWYNLKENGDLEERVKHAACPIIEGKCYSNRRFSRRTMLRISLIRVNCDQTARATIWRQ